MYRYTAFSLNIESEIELPALLHSEFKYTDVSIVLGKVDKNGLAEPGQIKPYVQMAENQLWLHVPDIAYFLVENGSRVVVEPLNGADMQSVRLYLMGSCMGAIMYQRNRLVIHGNAIRFGDECVIFAGASGNGKSTLAAAFHKKGYEILADDLSVIDEQCRVQPSYPQIKLWHDTAKKLDIDMAGLKRIRLQVDKYAYPLKASFCDTSLPVKAVYLLNTHNHDRFEFSEINGVNKFKCLKNNSYRVGYVEGLGLKANHLKLCANFANRVDVVRIIRPNAGFKLDELVDLIEADIKHARMQVA